LETFPTPAGLAPAMNLKSSYEFGIAFCMIMIIIYTPTVRSRNDGHQFLRERIGRFLSLPFQSNIFLIGPQRQDGWSLARRIKKWLFSQSSGWKGYRNILRPGGASRHGWDAPPGPFPRPPTLAASIPANGKPTEIAHSIGRRPKKVDRASHD